MYFSLDKKVPKDQDWKTFAKNEFRYTKANDMYVNKRAFAFLRFTAFIFFAQNFLCLSKGQLFDVVFLNNNSFDVRMPEQKE